MSFSYNLFGSTIYRVIFHKLIVIYFFIILLSACTHQDSNSEVIKGKWLLIAAERGGVPTTTLKDAYFNFVGDTLLRTNLLQEDQGYRYSFDGNEIIQEASTPITYEIKYLQEDTMILNTNIRKYDFTFLLVRDSIGLSIPQ